MDNLDQKKKNILLSQAVICDKPNSIFDKLKEKEDGGESCGGNKDLFAGCMKRAKCGSAKTADEAVSVEYRDGQSVPCGIPNHRAD